MANILKVHVDDTVTMRKPHACGGFDWVVTRVGADIGLRCVKCGRRVMIPRDEFDRRVRKLVSSPRVMEETALWEINAG